MMAEKFTIGDKNQLVRYAVQAEPLNATARVNHDPSFVAQLIAHASGLPNMPQRRHSDRKGPMQAYAPASLHIGRTRKIV